MTDHHTHTHRAVACFSYLAATHTLLVTAYPKTNYGVDVDHTSRFLAGDGPLVAGMLTALGHPATLFSNAVADDPDGHQIANRLAAWGVRYQPCPVNADQTRVNTVITDQAGNRTWFSGLKGITAELSGTDLDAVTSADTVYIDCYEVLGDTPRPVLEASLAARRDVIVNLGGSPAPSWLTTATGDTTRIPVLQTNADEHDTADRDHVLAHLAALDIADTVIVTVGRDGAIAHTRDGLLLTAAAVKVNVRQVQGAGSAFSAALIHARRNGFDAQTCLRFSCRAGSLWCARTAHGPLPTAADMGPP